MRFVLIAEPRHYRLSYVRMNCVVGLSCLRPVYISEDQHNFFYSSKRRLLSPFMNNQFIIIHNYFRFLVSLFPVLATPNGVFKYDVGEAFPLLFVEVLVTAVTPCCRIDTGTGHSPVTPKCLPFSTQKHLSPRRDVFFIKYPSIQNNHPTNRRPFVALCQWTYRTFFFRFLHVDAIEWVATYNLSLSNITHSVIF